MSLEGQGRRRVRRRAALLAALLLAILVVIEFAGALSLSFEGDDFELLAMARVGGFAPRALFVPHRGLFLKPVMNAAWAAVLRLAGTTPLPWYAILVVTHLLDAALLGFFVARLCESLAPPARAGSAPTTPAQGPPRRSALDGTDGVLTALGATALWAVHDRLAEPLFSLAAWNHSLAFLFYLAALVCLVRTLRAGGRAWWLATLLLLLIALLTYEVAVSVLPAGALVILLHPRSSKQQTPRRRAAAGALALAAFLWGAVQAAIRLAPGMTSYYTLAPRVLVRSFSEAGLSFLHVSSEWIAPGPFAAALLVAAWVAIFLAVGDRIVRFGLGWALAAMIPVAPIAELSDRYHYVVFAGLALAAARLLVLAVRTRVVRRDSGDSDGEPAASRSASVRNAAAGGIVVAHLVWSFVGAREQGAWYALRAQVPRILLLQSIGAIDAVRSRPAVVLGLVWEEAGGAAYARALAEGSSALPHALTEGSHPVYVRPDAILGLVDPTDLFVVAGASRGTFFRVPEPSVAARAVVSGSLSTVVFDPFEGLPGKRPADPSCIAALPAALREDLLARREIPVLLPERPSSGVAPRTPSSDREAGSERPAEEDRPRRCPALRVAYLEQTDRDGAYEAEYNKGASSRRARTEERQVAPAR